MRRTMDWKALKEKPVSGIFWEYPRLIKDIKPQLKEQYIPESKYKSLILFINPSWNCRKTKSERLY